MLKIDSFEINLNEIELSYICEGKVDEIKRCKISVIINPPLINGGQIEHGKPHIHIYYPQKKSESKFDIESCQFICKVKGDDINDKLKNKELVN